MGPVSSTGAGLPGAASAAGEGGVAGVGAGVVARVVRPCWGAGRLVPGTHEAPFQYRTYPGMDGSG